NTLREKGIYLVDVGTSGGVWGLERGYSMMVGGEKKAVDPLKSIFQTLAPSPRKGWGHVGTSGAGHFAKMVHNGIEYAVMAGLGEGLGIIANAKELGLDPAQVAEVWRTGSILSGFLTDLAARGLDKEGSRLGDIQPVVPSTGEGQWTVEEALERHVPAD